MMTKRLPFKVQQRVHIDADTQEYGRVCSDATVLTVFRNQYIMVNADTIRANIIILKSEASPIAAPPAGWD
jgi:hypothetical protein